MCRLTTQLESCRDMWQPTAGNSDSGLAFMKHLFEAILKDRLTGARAPKQGRNHQKLAMAPLGTQNRGALYIKYA